MTRQPKHANNRNGRTSQFSDALDLERPQSYEQLFEDYELRSVSDGNVDAIRRSDTDRHVFSKVGWLRANSKLWTVQNSVRFVIRARYVTSETENMEWFWR